MVRFTSFFVFIVAVLGFGLTAQAAPVLFTTSLSGAIEAPPNDSAGTGFARVTFDLEAHSMRVEATFSGLTGDTSAAHIHGPVAAPLGTAGVVTQVPSFTGFPLGVTSGDFEQVFDTLNPGTYNPVFLSSLASVEEAEAALFAMLMDGTSYFNIHSTEFPGGEIRGFLEAAAVPVPALPGLFVLGLASLLRSRRQRI